MQVPVKAAAVKVAAKKVESSDEEDSDDEDDSDDDLYSSEEESEEEEKKEEVRTDKDLIHSLFQPSIIDSKVVAHNPIPILCDLMNHPGQNSSQANSTSRRKQNAFCEKYAMGCYSRFTVSENCPRYLPLVRKFMFHHRFTD